MKKEKAVKHAKTHNSELRLVSFAALLGIVFMLIFSGVQLAEVPSMVGQAVKIAMNKATTTTTCSETDSGNENSVKGITTLKKNSRVQESKTDSCIDESHLKEYYCESNAIKETELDCVCDDGACVGYYAYKEEDTYEITPATQGVTITQSKSIKKESSLTAVAQTSIIATVGCVDSDKGKTYSEKGTTGDGSTSGTDGCRTNGDLVEYYCDENDVVQEEVVSCASDEVCSAGACITKGSCTDSESTFNMYAAGKVVGVWSTTGVLGEWTDKCDASGRVWEYYCTDTGYAYYNMKDCQAGYTCTEGKCEDLCVDTDEAGSNLGRDYTKQGTATGTWYTTGDEGSWTDYCYPDGTVYEMYCMNNYVYGAVTSCPSGTTCSNGACV